MSNLLILGAGGHGKVVADIAASTNLWDNIAFLDSNPIATSGLDHPILGPFDDYGKFIDKYKYAFVAIGNNRRRIIWLNYLEEAGYKLPVIIHPFSSVSKYSIINRGSVIMPGAIVNADVKVGRGAILNTSCSVDHDCILGIGVHISPGARLSGTVGVGDYTWVGVGSNISNNISIGSDVLVAAGSTVIKSVPSNVMVAGTPAKIKKTFGDEK
ncbi:acetyltransferase [Paenibacillus sp. CN-4]|uniref:acetyltransferase n=1 Tax=Paenibacillus nanchangensis TaxID=3348343 RepID=UPI00397CB873